VLYFCFEKNVLGLYVERKDLRSFEEKWYSWTQNDLVCVLDHLRKTSDGLSVLNYV
jgi:hypothetical protein